MPTRIVLVVLAALLALSGTQTASPVAARQRQQPVTRTYSNPTRIDLAESESSPVSGSLYPSPIVVSRLKGTIRDVNLTLNNLQHDFPENVEVLLVGPRGQTAIMLAHVGTVYDVADMTLRLDDEAKEPLPEDAMLPSGTFRPTNVRFNPGELLVFNAPAPAASANTSLSVFDGTNPNGTWNLFVEDLDGPSDFGKFTGGWELEITAKGKVKKER
jgi:subtilisin-like proprotein convertase family protein